MRANFFQPYYLSEPFDELRWHQRLFLCVHLAIGLTLLAFIVVAPFAGLYQFLVLGERLGLLAAAVFLLLWAAIWQVNRW